MNYFFLCRFFRSFFLRLCVAILCLFRFLPQGTDSTPLPYSTKTSPYDDRRGGLQHVVGDRPLWSHAPSPVKAVDYVPDTALN
jgi:hypothetical protein